MVIEKGQTEYEFYFSDVSDIAIRDTEIALGETIRVLKVVLENLDKLYSNQTTRPVFMHIGYGPIDTVRKELAAYINTLIEKWNNIDEFLKIPRATSPEDLLQRGYAREIEAFLHQYPQYISQFHAMEENGLIQASLVHGHPVRLRFPLMQNVNLYR